MVVAREFGEGRAGGPRADRRDELGFPARASQVTLIEHPSTFLAPPTYLALLTVRRAPRAFYERHHGNG
jgi:hypothetical protein